MYDLVTEESFRGRGVEGLGPSRVAGFAPTGGWDEVHNPQAKPTPGPKGPGSLDTGAKALFSIKRPCS